MAIYLIPHTCYASHPHQSNFRMTLELLRVNTATTAFLLKQRKWSADRLTQNNDPTKQRSWIIYNTQVFSLVWGTQKAYDSDQILIIHYIGFYHATSYRKDKNKLGKFVLKLLTTGERKNREHLKKVIRKSLD